MSELHPVAPQTSSEQVDPIEELGEASHDVDTVEEISSSDTLRMIDDYISEHGTVHGLSMKELVEKGFDPDTVLVKIGNERLEEKLDVVKIRYHAERGTEQWRQMEKKEARNIPMAYGELEALIDAGTNPQHIVDALQRTEPEDGVDNPSSAQIAAHLDELVDAGLPPAIVAARLNPSWRGAVKDQLAEAEIRWHKANRQKALAS